MWYPTYLVHFNKNHSSKDGRFTSGDGDGDGIANDHHNRAQNKEVESKKSSGGGGAINLDDEDTGEDDDYGEEQEPGKGITSKYTLKELMKRQNQKKNKKDKKKAKGGSSRKKKKSTKNKKVKTEKIKMALEEISDKAVPSDNDLLDNASAVEDVLDGYDETTVSEVIKILGK